MEILGSSCSPCMLRHGGHPIGLLPPRISVQSPSPAWRISRLLHNATTEHPSRPIPSSLSMVGPTTPPRLLLCPIQGSRLLSGTLQKHLPGSALQPPLPAQCLIRCATPGPPHTRTECPTAPSLVLLAAWTAYGVCRSYTEQRRLQRAPRRRTVLRGRTAHVPQPRESAGPFQYFRIRVRSAPQNGCFFPSR